MAIVFLQYSYVCTNAPISFCIPEGILSGMAVKVFFLNGDLHVPGAVESWKTGFFSREDDTGVEFSETFENLFSSSVEEDVVAVSEQNDQTVVVLVRFQNFFELQQFVVDAIPRVAFGQARHSQLQLIGQDRMAETGVRRRLSTDHRVDTK